MLGDKDIAGALAPLAGKVDVWLLATLDVPRGASAEVLADVVLAEKLGGSIECFASPALAFAQAAKLAGENDKFSPLDRSTRWPLSCVPCRTAANPTDSTHRIQWPKLPMRNCN